MWRSWWSYRRGTTAAAGAHSHKRSTSRDAGTVTARRTTASPRTSCTVCRRSYFRYPPPCPAPPRPCRRRCCHSTTRRRPRLLRRRQRRFAPRRRRAAVLARDCCGGNWRWLRWSALNLSTAGSRRRGFSPSLEGLDSISQLFGSARLFPLISSSRLLRSQPPAISPGVSAALPIPILSFLSVY